MLPLSLDIPLMKRAAARRPETLLAHLGRDPASHFGTVNTPVYHASTLLFDSVEAYHEAGQHRLERGKSSYGRTGTPTTFAFEETVAALEGGYGAVAVASGLQAVTVVLVRSGGRPVGTGGVGTCRSRWGPVHL